MKLNKLLSICLGITLAFSVSANDLSEARIYINPGHGGWGPNDRPMATINYAQMDTLGFFETNTNLIKGMALREELVKAGAGYVRMSRTVNGVVAADDEHKTENDKYIETQYELSTDSLSRDRFGIGKRIDKRPRYGSCRMAICQQE